MGRQRRELQVSDKFHIEDQKIPHKMLIDLALHLTRVTRREHHADPEFVLERLKSDFHIHSFQGFHGLIDQLLPLLEVSGKFSTGHRLRRGFVPRNGTRWILYRDDFDEST